MRSHTVTTVLPAPKREVFGYMSEIENLPEWATEFARELRRDEDGYTVVNNLGEFRFEIRADEADGRDRHARRANRRRDGAVPNTGGRTGRRTHGLLVHDVPGSRDARRTIRGAVRIAQARVREHRGPVRVADSVKAHLALVPQRQNRIRSGRHGIHPRLVTPHSRRQNAKLERRDLAGRRQPQPFLYTPRTDRARHSSSGEVEIVERELQRERHKTAL